MGAQSCLPNPKWSLVAFVAVSLATITLFLMYHIASTSRWTPSAILGPPSAILGTPSAILGTPSAILGTPSAILGPSAATNRTNGTWVTRTDPCMAVKGAPSTLACGMTINALGRLGNLMGEYAALLALSELNHRPAVLLPEMADVLGLYFRISLPTMGPTELAFWEPRWTIKAMLPTMDPSYARLADDPFSYLYGYTCSWTFFHHLRERVLREFQFHDHILSRTQRVLADVRRDRASVTFVGVHNRRGDYVDLMSGTFRGVLADGGFFHKAFEMFEAEYPDAVFLVVSDDMEWCRRNMDASRGNVHFVGGGADSRDPIYDLALLANCNHSIITIGTFGFWGAYLAGGRTVHLTDYLLPDSPFRKVFRYDALYLPEWMPITANLSAFEGLKKTGSSVTSSTARHQVTVARVELDNYFG